MSKHSFVTQQVLASYATTRRKSETAWQQHQRVRADAVRHLRGEGLSHAGIAKLLEISPTRVRQIERGERR